MTSQLLVPKNILNRMTLVTLGLNFVEFSAFLRTIRNYVCTYFENLITRNE